MDYFAQDEKKEPKGEAHVLPKSRNSYEKILHSTE